ncbi:MAG: ATP-binding protein [Syntrophomonadaceae bacterium]|nr:ATP-binding protein [Syntrophomonadaceae bacterium]
MINEETRRKLREMSMEDMITVLDMQNTDSAYASLPFDDRFKLIVDYTYQGKYNDKVKRLLKQAKLRIPAADINDIYYSDRGLDKSLILELGTCQFILTNSNIIFQGFTGSGKSFLACSLGKQACKQGVCTRYIRLPDLLMLKDEAANVRQGASKLLTKFSRYRLLLIDEWLFENLSEEELHFIFELMERRHDNSSTIFCTQYKLDNWHSRLGGGILADSIMDRIVHKAVNVYAGNINMREMLAKAY